jgi:hypothetical protein
MPLSGLLLHAALRFAEKRMHRGHCIWLSMASSHLGRPTVDFVHGSSDEKGFVVREQDVTTLATSDSRSRLVVLRE